MSGSFTLAARVHEAWKASGLTRAQVAASAHMSWSQLYKILEGRRRSVSSDTVCRLARALNVSADYLLGLDDTQPRQAHQPRATEREE